ncbi:LYR motif-containing protein 2 isoform X2 [Pangasianodon hypophthalmus]|uniref:LYR motif-containing protein 2 isoform X2 n=1 Tax=Pangasianodon hypophthalmus TaxID=310915 RepID=UPI002307E154|nr:LYR motif-containing protein 2 isoform X2 [Pangasianodon hypophthalmus]
MNINEPALVHYSSPVGGSNTPWRCSLSSECRSQNVTEMSVSRLPPSALTLKQFLQRQKVLGLYRNMLRTIRQVPDEADRKYLKDWAREEFKRNKEATDQIVFKIAFDKRRTY